MCRPNKYLCSDDHGNLSMKDAMELYECSGCKMKGVGPHYTCQDVTCNFSLHKDCYNSERRQTLQHNFYPEESFVFYDSPNKCGFKGRYCNACGMDIKGYFYCGKRYDLHPCCASLPPNCDQNGVIMTLQRETTKQCVSCCKKEVKVDSKRTDQIWSYVAEDGCFSIHISCMIKDLPDLNERKIKRRDDGKVEIEIATPKWMTKLMTSLMKYAKIVLGVLIAVLFGDPTVLFTSLIINLTSQ